MEICAHRCRGFGFKENGIRAIRAALQSEVDAIEIDVRLTKDLKWIVIHAPFSKTEHGQVKRVHEHTFSQLRREVVALDVVLALYSALGEGKSLFIDVKDVGEERQLVTMVRRHSIQDRTVVIAWEPEILKRVHRVDPTLRLGLSYVTVPERLGKVKGVMHKPLTRSGVLLRFNELHSFDTGFAIGKTHQHYLSSIPDLPLYSIQVFSLFCSAKLVKEARNKGIKVIAFVVNNRISASLLEKRGVHGILTNKPILFLN